MNLGFILKITELTLAGLLIIAVLIQSKGAGLSGIFGGEGNVYRTKRGAEKIIFIFTIICAALFVGVALTSIFLVTK